MRGADSPVVVITRSVSYALTVYGLIPLGHQDHPRQTCFTVDNNKTFCLPPDIDDDLQGAVGMQIPSGSETVCTVALIYLTADKPF